ncbi:ferritin-like domain-containing protein [Pontibacter sp. MBLB2868]|uniref:ferritin-like domain-containing protein n=1 Tax=Pontibacter sp. MBLB2868 TaxID=3451555 RepID=UPI003F74C4C7
MKLNNLKDLFIHELKDLYNAEHQILKAMPKMIDAAAAVELKRALKDHLRETETQVERLDKVFKMLDEKATGEKCKAMEGIIRESDEMISQRADKNVMDAALISMAQRVEHYEIAGYGTVCTYAKQLGMHDVLDQLQMILSEEKKADETLTYIAEHNINMKAEHNAK